MKLSKNMTIGKIVLSLIAIGVMFVPVYAVQSIEARAIDHALAVEGLYVNGTGIQATEFTNESKALFETIYPYVANDTGSDSAITFRGSGINRAIYYRDQVVYAGNDTYSVSLNYSDEPAFIYYDRNLFIPLAFNTSQLSEPDFIRISSTLTGRTPKIWVLGEGIVGGAVYGIPPGSSVIAVANNSYIWVNTIASRSWFAQIEDSCGDNTQVYLMYELTQTDPVVEDFTFKVQEETYTGADILTWTDETLYIMAVMLCDILLVGAIVFASDPIDIAIDRPKRRR